MLVERRSPAAFASVTYGVVVMLMASNLPTPLYPVYERAFGLTPLGVTLVYATYAAVVLVCLPFTGSLSDAVGRRNVLLPAIALSVLAAALFAAATGVAWLVAAQVVEGVSMAALQGAAVPALVEVEPGHDVDRASLVGSAAVVGGAALGPLLTGVLAEYLPWPRRLAFVVAGALLVAAAAGVARWFPHDGRMGRRWRPARLGVPAEMRATFLVAALSACCAWAVASLFLSLVPSYVVATVHTRNLAVIGAAAAAMMAASALVQLTSGRTLSPIASQIAGLAFVAAAAVALVVVAWVHLAVTVVVAGVLAGVGLGLAFRGAVAAVSAAAPDDRRGDVIAAFYVIGYVGTGAPVVAVGVLSRSIGLVPAVERFGWVAAAAATATLALASRTDVRTRVS